MTTRPVPASLDLHIEELHLEGFAPADRHHIGDALQRELTRLLTEHGVPASLERGGVVDRLDAGTFEVPGGGDAESTGVRLAQAIHRGFGR